MFLYISKIQFKQSSQLSVTLPFQSWRHIQSPIKHLWAFCSEPCVTLLYLGPWYIRSSGMLWYILGVVWAWDQYTGIRGPGTPSGFKSGIRGPTRFKNGIPGPLQNLGVGFQDPLQSLKVGPSHLSLMNSFFLQNI